MVKHPIDNAENLEAKSKFDQYKYNDPFQQIEPALLNPNDIEQYVNTTGMIYPFYKQNLKSATYGIPLYGEIHYWDSDGQKQCQELSHNNTIDNVFILKPNSIAYIQISTTFRIPYYLIFRFNLRIDLVHKGLLLGTGPVVDAGFEGKIMIPLHNLTANTYHLFAGDVLIWVEITKLSKNALLNEVVNHGTEYLYEFPQKATYQDANEYFKKVNQRSPIRSSIDHAVESVKKDAETALKNSQESKIFSIAIFISFIALLSTLAFYGWKVTSEYSNLVHDQKYKIKELEENINKINKQLKNQ